MQIAVIQKSMQIAVIKKSMEIVVIEKSMQIAVIKKSMQIAVIEKSMQIAVIKNKHQLENWVKGNPEGNPEWIHHNTEKIITVFNSSWTFPLFYFNHGQAKNIRGNLCVASLLFSLRCVFLSLKKSLISELQFHAG